MRKSRMTANALTTEMRNRIGAEYEAGANTAALSRKYGTCQSFISKCVKGSGRSIRPQVLRAAGKLTNEQKEEAIRDYRGGMNCDQVAAKFGLKQSASVWEMLHRRGVTRPTRVTNRRHKLNERAFDELTPEAAYWAGFLITDGCLSEHRDGHYLILTLGEKDHRHVERFRDFIGSTHPIRSVDNSRGYGTGRSASLHIRACGLAAPLMRLGVVPKKTHTATAPPTLAFNRDFWRGCVDGDGTVAIYTRKNTTRTRPFVQLVGASLRLVEQFSEYARTTSNAPWKVERGSHVYVSRAYDRRAATLIKILYENCAVALDRKLAVANRVVKGVSSI